MVTLALDFGSPLPAFAAGSTSGLSLSTSVCPSPTCSLLHLRAARATEGQRVLPQGPDGELGPDELVFDFDTAKRELTPAREAAQAYLASDEGAWLPGWVAGHEELLRGRFDRLKGQQEEAPVDARPAPPWKPGTQILHQQLYPFDFTPWLEHDDKLWLIADATCPDPGCPCQESSLTFFGTDGTRIDAAGRLGDPEPEKADDAGRALWRAVHDDEELLDGLQERYEDIRAAGPFVVGTAYEQARLAARVGRKNGAPHPVPQEGGYLDGGAIPVALVERLFAVGARLHAARGALGLGLPSWMHVEVHGAIERDAWGLVEEEPFSVDLYRTLADDAPELSLLLASRDHVTLAHSRQRLALGLPLLGGTSLPLVDRLPADLEGEDPLDAERIAPGADDVRVAIAVAEALLALPLDEVERREATPFVLEHRVEMDTGPLEVRLTTSPAERPWVSDPHLGHDLEDHDHEGHDHEGHDHEGHDHEGHDHEGHDHEGHRHGGPELAELDDDEDDEDEDDDGEPEQVAATAFIDAALDRELPPKLAAKGGMLIDVLSRITALEESDLPWHDPRNFGRLLEGSPELTRGDVETAPAAMHAIADWLGEMGHADAAELHALIDQRTPAFLKKSRTPRRGSASARPFRGPRLAPPVRAEPPATPHVVTRSPDRWKPAPGEAVPDAAAPCPCGSGRRYKKCCMPR